MISGWLYGEKDGSKLTAEQKETVVAITGLLGTTVGAVTGNTAANAVQGSLNANSAVKNNFDAQDVKDNWDRLTGGLLGVGASFGQMGVSTVEPILHPIETWQGLKAFATHEDKIAVLEMALVLVVEERNRDYQTYVELGDEFGKGMVIGRSVADIASAVTMVSKAPSEFAAALRIMKNGGTAIIMGVKVAYIGGRITPAADKYSPSIALVNKPVLAIVMPLGHHSKFSLINPAEFINPLDISILKVNGVKFTSENLVATIRNAAGKVIF